MGLGPPMLCRSAFKNTRNVTSCLKPDFRNFNLSEIKTNENMGKGWGPTMEMNAWERVGVTKF